MDQVQSLLGRPQEYYNVDGVGELAMGFMCLSFALLGWLQAHAPRESAWHGGYAFVGCMGVMLAILHYGPKVIKNRITYPRTGFVEYRAMSKFWPALLGGAVSALFSVVLWLSVRRHWQLSEAGLIVGLLLAASYIRIARTVRWKWAVFGTMVVAAFAIAALPASALEDFVNRTSLTPAVPARALGSYWLTFIVYGALLLISGGISMRLYLRRTRAPQQASE
jgi:hypothetical protein